MGKKPAPRSAGFFSPGKNRLHPPTNNAILATRPFRNMLYDKMPFSYLCYRRYKLYRQIQLAPTTTPSSHPIARDTKFLEEFDE